MSRRSRIPFSDIARRITGISVLSIFGVNWQPPEDRRDIVRRLVIFLEDRRALYADYHMEHGPWVERSVIEMRAELTKILETCPDDEGLTGPIRAMRAACRKFLDEAQHPGRSRLSASPCGTPRHGLLLVNCAGSSACTWPVCARPTAWMSKLNSPPSFRHPTWRTRDRPLHEQLYRSHRRRRNPAPAVRTAGSPAARTHLQRATHPRR